MKNEPDQSHSDISIYILIGIVCIILFAAVIGAVRRVDEGIKLLFPETEETDLADEVRKNTQETARVYFDAGVITGHLTYQEIDPSKVITLGDLCEAARERWESHLPDSASNPFASDPTDNPSPTP